MSKGIVCISGVTGYIGAHVAKECLENGYAVRGTVRSLQKKKGLEHVDRWKQAGWPIELVEADLLNEKSWEAACEGADYVMHVASPFVVGVTKKDAEEVLYRPAVEGTVNVLQAALAKGIKKVVLTSSVAAFMGGHAAEEFEGVEPETIWTDTEAKDVDPYVVSKARAERAAWDFYEKHKAEGFELVTINPSFVLGPPVSSGNATSHEFLVRLFKGSVPMIPNMRQNVVDVRDVAKAHVLALESDKANGERLCCSGYNGLGFVRIAKLVKAATQEYGYSIRTMEAPYIALQLLSLFDSTIRVVKNGMKTKHAHMSNDKIRRVLEMEFIPVEQTVAEHAHGVLQLGIDGVKMTAKYRKALEAGEVKNYTADLSLRK